MYIVGEMILNQNIILALIFICCGCKFIVVAELIAVGQVSQFGAVFHYMRSILNTTQMKVSGFNES